MLASSLSRVFAVPDLPTYDAPTTPLPAVDLVRIPSAAAALAPRYQVKEELGRGGMGVVYLAHDSQLERPVAIKVLLGGGFAGANQRQRLLSEAVTVARLDHPNIVRLYEVGEFEKVPYLVLEYVGGETLRQRSHRCPFTPVQAAAIVATLARAVQYAHSLGVIHRDLKPQNVLLRDGADGSPIPKLTDFGIAKRVGEQAEATATGVLLGTPIYMAPEQAASRRAEIGPRTDVYALGAILYELLAGRPPYLEDEPAQVALQVLLQTPPPPRTIRPTTPAALEAICLKCLEKSPDRRYQSALQLADDLDRWSRGEVPTARPPGWVVRVARRTANRRFLTIALILALFAASTTFATLLATGRPPPSPREEAERQLSAGRSVTLIGETGLPLWHRWAMSAATLTTSAAILDDTTSFKPDDFTLLELLSDPMTDRYRLTAEIRDDTPSGFFNPDFPKDENRIIGLYCGHRHALIPNVGEVHRFLSVHLTDRMLPDDTQVGRPHRHRARCEITTVTRPLKEDAEGFQVSEFGAVRFDPAEQMPRPWRKIRIEVTPETVEAYWEGEKGSERFGRWSATDLDRIYQHWPPAAFSIPDGTPLPGVLRWVPRSPLGVFARGTPVSVRNVVVEPLPIPEN